MALSTNIAMFHKEIFPKVKYDETLEQYRINIDDYIKLNLNQRQFRTLERICIENNIYLEKLPKQLSIQAAEDLFIKLYDLKKELKNNPNHPDKKEFEKQIIDIRTKLIEGHQKLLYIFLYNKIPNLEESEYKDDIIQSANIFLIINIDAYNPYASSQTFRKYFWDYASRNIFRKAMSIQNKSSIGDYNTMKVALDNMEEYEYISDEDLSKETGLSHKRVIELLVLKQIINADSIEELCEQDTQSLDLQHNNLEEQVNKELLKKLLIMMLGTLPNEMQKEVVISRYGLDGKLPQRFEEIATNKEITNRQRAQQHYEDAIKNLRNPIRAKYIKELVEGYSQISLCYEEEISSIDEQDLSYEKLELFLMKYLQQEELQELIMQLDIKYREVLFVYFNFDEEEYITHEDRLKKLGITFNRYQERKRKGLFNLRTIMKYKYVLHNKNENIKTVLDFLMYNYLYGYKSKAKTRKI